jgi:hypothetical protein
VTEKSVMAPSATASPADGLRPGVGRLFRAAMVTVMGAALLVVPVGAASADTSGSVEAEIVIASGLLLVGLPSGVSLTGQPGDLASETVPFTYQVFSNDMAGYTVTVQAAEDKMYAGSSDFITVDRLEVQDGAVTPSHSWTAMSSLSAVSVYSRASRSETDGDNLSTNFQMSLPVVAAGTYTMTLDYVVAINT